MQTQVESAVKNEVESAKTNKSTIVKKTISEENKTLFDFMKRRAIEEGFTMVGQERAEPVKNFWSYFTGDKFLYTASFEKTEVIK